MAKTPRSAAKQKSDILRNMRRRYETAAKKAKASGTKQGQLAARAYEKRAQELRVPTGLTKAQREEFVSKAIKQEQKSVNVQASTIKRKNVIGRGILQGNTGATLYKTMQASGLIDGSQKLNEQRFVDAMKKLKEKRLTNEGYSREDIAAELESYTLTDAIEEFELVTGIGMEELEQGVSTERYESAALTISNTLKQA